MGPSVWQLLIVLLIVLVLFGAKRLRTLGGDVGTAVKGFKDAVKDGKEAASGDAQKLENAAAEETANAAEKQKDKV